MSGDSGSGAMRGARAPAGAEAGAAAGAGEPGTARHPNEAPLRVSIDATAVPARPAGAGRYVVDLVRSLARREDAVLTIWVRRDDSTRWERANPEAVARAEASGRASVRAAAAGDGAGGSLTIEACAPRSRAARLAWEQARLPSLLAANAPAVHHAPHYTMPERARLPRVVTIHDLTFFDHPEWHERTKVPFFRRAIRRAALGADALVCVSERTEQRLIELLAPSAPVFVVPHGVDAERFRPLGDSSEEDELLARYGVRTPYLAFVGTIEPRKAVPVLVEAFDLLASSHPELQLVLAGGEGWGTDASASAIAHARHGSRIVRTGYVHDDDLPALLRRSAAAVYPALLEGFGLPALEAMASGVPLVTTSGSVMSELAAGAAWEAEPGSASSLAEAIECALAGGTEVARRVQLGLSVAARCTWEVSAGRHMEVYRFAARRETRRS